MSARLPPPPLVAIAGALRDWTCNEALPFWANAGFNRNLGCFHEALHADGTPNLAVPLRLRVQARQIYVYSHAAVLGWFPEGTGLALKALDGMLARFHAPDGEPGFVHTISPDGRVDNPLRDTYDHAFMLLALAWLARASGDAQVHALIDRVLGFVDATFGVGDGTCREDTANTLPRRQNPHMHLYEAMLALHEAVGHPEALGRAKALRGLLTTHFLDAQSGALVEFFTADWRPHPPGQPIEPGHHAEWSWLLHHHARLAGIEAGPAADRLLDLAMRTQQPGLGVLPDAAGLDGRPATNFARCWPQTECAKALLARYERAPTDAAAGAAVAALDGLRRHYLSGVLPGAWRDRIALDGTPVAVTVPAGNLYHLFAAIAEAARMAQGENDQCK